MIPHSNKDGITLKEFFASGECPWSYEWLKQYASKSVNGIAPFSEAPFYRATPHKGSRIKVNPTLFRIWQLKGASKGYRKSTL